MRYYSNDFKAVLDSSFEKKESSYAFHCTIVLRESDIKYNTELQDYVENFRSIGSFEIEEVEELSSQDSRSLK